MKRGQRWNNLRICPRRDSNTGGSDQWSNTLPLNHGGTHRITKEHADSAQFGLCILTAMWNEYRITSQPMFWSEILRVGQVSVIKLIILSYKITFNQQILRSWILTELKALTYMFISQATEIFPFQIANCLITANKWIKHSVNAWVFNSWKLGWGGLWIMYKYTRKYCFVLCNLPQ